MFDMRYTGRMIAQARKAKDMTQTELADALNISFQAVSNWERGASMPDISKLPELSEILGISIDEMLGKSSTVIKDVLIQGDFSEATVGEIVEAAPILKPKQMERLVEKMEEKIEVKMETEKKINWDEILQALEYLSEDFIGELFRRAVAEGNNRVIEEMLEYVEEDDVDEIARKRYEQGGVDAIRNFLEYMTEDAVNEIAKEVYAKDGISALEPLAEYMFEDLLDEIAMDAMKKGGVKAAEPIMDYIDCETILEKFLREKYF